MQLATVDERGGGVDVLERVGGALACDVKPLSQLERGTDMALQAFELLSNTAPLRGTAKV